MRINSGSFSPPALPSADDALDEKFDQLECEVDSKQATDADASSGYKRYHLEYAWPS
jgi:hypothetical protein